MMTQGKAPISLKNKVTTVASPTTSSASFYAKPTPAAPLRQPHNTPNVNDANE